MRIVHSRSILPMLSAHRSYLTDVEVLRLLSLLGAAAEQPTQFRENRRMLLDSLGEWIGADGWCWMRDADGRWAGWSHGIDAHRWNAISDRYRSGGLVGEFAALDGRIIYQQRLTPERTCVAFLRGARREPFCHRQVSLSRVVLDEVDWLFCDRPSDAAPEQFPLSTRQVEISRCLMQGMSRKEISDHLGLSADTLASHIRRIYQRLGVHSHTEFLTRFLSP